MLGIFKIPMDFEYVFLEAQMELEDKLGHLKYLEDLKSPFLMFSGTSDNFDHFGGDMKMKPQKINKNPTFSRF